MENKMQKKVALGIDIGGTKIKAGLVNAAGKVLSAEVAPTCKERGEEYVLKQIEEMIGLLKNSSSEEIQGIGLALPGQVDDQGGYCLYCPNLGWGKVEISRRLTEKTGLPVKLINDANAACLGEFFYGKGEKTKIFLSITLGTGVGSGLILNGQLFNGRFGSGVEAGHMVIDPAGYPCSCGRRGCWETLISAPGIIRRTKERLKIIKDSQLAKLTLTPETIFQAAREGDLLAKKIVEETVFYLAIGLANLINLFNPFEISLGGGVAEAEEIITPNLIEQIDENVFPTMKGRVKIYKATQGYYGGVIGASTLWLQKSSSGEEYCCER